jgi:hypothetical protein
MLQEIIGTAATGSPAAPQTPATPKIGDTWVGKDDKGKVIRKKVTSVKPASGPDKDAIIAIDSSQPQHVGWWASQGWSKEKKPT